MRRRRVQGIRNGKVRPDEDSMEVAEQEMADVVDDVADVER